jgi:hypothetical protein
MAKKSKTNGAARDIANEAAIDAITSEAQTAFVKATDLREPDAAQAIATLQATILEDIDALIRMVEPTHAKIVRPFKRAAEEKLRAVGWAVLDAKMATHMQTLNGQRTAQKAEREAKKAEAQIAALTAKAEKAKAAAEAQKAAAEKRLAELRARA